MSERTFDDFDQHASQYRKIHTQNVKITGADSYYFAAHKIELLKEYENDHPSRLLDIGCSDGVVETFIEKEFPSFKINAIDVSAESISLANEKNLKNSIFQCYDGGLLPFNENQFDIIFVAAVLHHIDFSLHHVFLKEALRVLKPGGRIYIFEHNPKNPVTRYIVNTCVFDKDAKLLDSKYAFSILQNAGFKKISTRFILFFPRKKWLKSLIKLEKKLASIPFGAQYMISGIK